MEENLKRRSVRQVAKQSVNSDVKENLCEEEHNGKDSVAEAPSTETSNKDTTGGGKGSRSSSRRRSLEGAQICPVCGVTVRPSEVEQHFRYEVQQIDHIVKRGRVLKDSQTAYALSKQREREGGDRKKQVTKRKRRRTRNESDSEESSSSDSDSESSVEVDPQLTLLEVRGNRHARERKKKLLENPECNPDTMLCPVCFIPLIGSEVDRNRHVENCLTGCPSTASAINADDAVDVDGEGLGVAGGGVMEEESGAGNNSYDVYEWMGETRLRTVSLVPGGYQGLGYQITSSRKSQDANDEDDDLDVDGDETEEFGSQQYSEEDVPKRCHSRSSQEIDDVGYEDHVNDNHLIEACLGMECDSGSATETETKHSVRKHIGLPSASIQIVVESLKARVKELEEQNEVGNGRLKCQICLGAYNTPLVSIQCWHVHCEDCWMKTLASKKLCPQCQMITAPSKLRKVYL